MPINPADISTVRVGQLPSEPFNLTDLVPHEVGTDLKQGTIQDLADVIGAYLDVSEGVGFRAVTVNDGDTLPNTDSEEFILVGAGTFINVGGGANITTTEELNALVSNGTYWFIGVEIPISAEAQNITQFVRDGFTSTTPSEDAVFELTKNHIDDVLAAGTYVRTPGAWQELDLAIGDETNTLFRAVCNVGLVDVQADAFQVARADDTHLNVTGTSIGVIFPNFFDTLPAAPNGSIKQVPTNTNYPLSSLTGELPTAGTQGVYYLGWRNSTQAFETSTTSYVQNPNVFHCGVIFLKNVAGVISFIDATRTVIPMPDVAQYSNLETTAIGVKSNVFILPNAGGMTVKNPAGELVGLSVNYKGTNNDAKAISLNATISFRRLNPGNANATSLPAATTTVSVTDYWNGTAMTALAANGNSSVQRWLLTVMGTFILQPGEAQYTNFQEGKDNVYTATFTDFIPKGTFVELGRMVAVKNATNLGDNTQAVFVGTGSSGGGGGSVSSVSFAAITGLPEDNVNLAASLNAAIHKTGDESITSGIKTLSTSSPSHKLYLSNNGSAEAPLHIVNGSSSTGYGLVLYNQAAAPRVGLYVNNSNTGRAMHIDNGSSGTGFLINNDGSGAGMLISGSSTGKSLWVSNIGNGDCVVSNTSGSGKVFVGQNNGVETSSITKEGLITGTGIIKSGGTSSQYLMADGSISTGGTIVKTRKDITGTTYTLLSSDVDKILYTTNSSPVVITIPSGLTVGQSYEVLQYAAGQVSYVASGTTLVYSSYVQPKHEEINTRVVIEWIDTNKYQLYGELSAY